MTDDASLTDFSSAPDRDDGGDDATADRDAPTATPAAEATDTGTDAAETGGDGDGVEAAVDTETRSTYAWGEYTCARCDQSTDRVWRDDGAFVCPGCKSW